MLLNDELIDNLANLACLEFSVSEKQQIKTDLQRMISFVEKLGELDLAGVQPLVNMSDAENVFRDDIVEGSLDRQRLLENAPLADSEYIKVPKVISQPNK